MIIIESIQETCGGCPMIWEGKTTEGQDFYIRFRWGLLRLVVNKEVIFAEQISDGLDGIMSLDEALIHLNEHIRW